MIERLVRRRDARGQFREEYVGAHYCVLRFEAPLAERLRLPVELRELTSGKATHQIVLSRYA